MYWSVLVYSSKTGVSLNFSTHYTCLAVPFTMLMLALQLKQKTRKDIFKRAEKYVREYRRAEKDEIRLKREAKRVGNYYVSAEAKLAFVIRIKG